MRAEVAGKRASRYRTIACLASLLHFPVVLTEASDEGHHARVGVLDGTQRPNEMSVWVTGSAFLEAADAA